MEKEWAQEMYEKLKAKLAAECKRNQNNIPYIPVNGRYCGPEEPLDIFMWTNGFWPGMLWQMYNAAKDERRACRKPC